MMHFVNSRYLLIEKNFIRDFASFGKITSMGILLTLVLYGAKVSAPRHERAESRYQYKVTIKQKIKAGNHLVAHCYIQIMKLNNQPSSLHIP